MRTRDRRNDFFSSHGCVVANYSLTKVTRPSTFRYSFNLVPNSDRVYLVNVVFQVFMAAISKWYLSLMELPIPSRSKVCAISFYRTVIIKHLQLGRKLAAEAVVAVQFEQFANADTSCRLDVFPTLLVL